MKSPTKGSLRSALKTIRNNRGRSFATMLGIIIGVVSALVVVGIGQGIQRQVGGQIEKLGKDLIVIRPGSTSSNLSDLVGLSQNQTLTDSDVKTVQSVGGIASVTPLSQVDGAVSISEGEPFHGTLVGTNSSFAKDLHQTVEYGGFYSDETEDAFRVVVGANVATNVFGEAVPLGRAVTVRDQTFVVVGVLKQFEATPFAGQVDFNNAMFLPYSTAQAMTKNTAPVFQIIVRPSDHDTIDSTADALTKALRREHGGSTDTFSVLTQGDNLAVTNDILNLLATLVLASASVALLVGGIGIMNIMLVSVTERMHEIGIRKAVGATNRQILSQFMTEAVVLSVIGWVLAVLFAIVGIYLIRLFTSIEAVVPWATVFFSAIVTLAVGTFFGSIPALKAARKDPIDALRNE